MKNETSSKGLGQVVECHDIVLTKITHAMETTHQKGPRPQVENKGVAVPVVPITLFEWHLPPIPKPLN